MTNLKCDACSCAHNKDHLCQLVQIEVGKTSATSSEDTCCESYSKCCTSNAMIDNTPGGQLTIHCEAVKCVYNDNKYCTAKSVDIGDHDAEKFSETKCETFKMSN